ncbi:hypothetical protein O7602_15680 [Micromonospora sp. WMMD1128]|uniref:hypothetical protein n=1 Tax=Micromonospora sp. WMMD1128 TaxID=3015150 RepID=UPI00248D2F71|nr:hypothetical protein [Micromonospora sp. WMMD1128]WBB71202.1 hypothetical protein O7602_15680 [Micromonospora sp. WMMD1128]
MAKPTRWVTDTEPGHSQWYVDRFRRLAAEGADLAGEARLIDALVPPGARILDAGCGTGRVAAALAAGLRPEHRFATWDLRPWRDDAGFVVTVLRRPA